MMRFSTPEVTLKLFIDKKTKKVLYGEAGKDFVDFLFTILSLPLGTVTMLLSKENMLGTLGNLYQSIEDLGDVYIHPKQLKSRVLNPSLLHLSSRVTHLFSNTKGTPPTVKLYSCLSSSCLTVTDHEWANCPCCRQLMCKTTDFVDPACTNERVRDFMGREGGFVKSGVPYMIMDNLEVKPIMSSMSVMALFNELNIKDVGSVEEKVIPLGMDEGLRLLKASLQTESVLTTVFLRDQMKG